MCLSADMQYYNDFGVNQPTSALIKFEDRGDSILFYEFLLVQL